jgi:hypothetical protein
VLSAQKGIAVNLVSQFIQPRQEGDYPNIKVENQIWTLYNGTGRSQSKVLESVLDDDGEETLA